MPWGGRCIPDNGPTEDGSKTVYNLYRVYTTYIESLNGHTLHC